MCPVLLSISPSQEKLSSPATRTHTYILSRYAATLAHQEEKHFWGVLTDLHGVNTGLPRWFSGKESAGQC